MESINVFFRAYVVYYESLVKMRGQRRLDKNSVNIASGVEYFYKICLLYTSLAIWKDGYYAIRLRQSRQIPELCTTTIRVHGAKAF